jgi:hypothetical protein
MTKQCPNCGARIAEVTDAFCSECGNTIAAPGPERGTAATSSAADQDLDLLLHCAEEETHAPASAPTTHRQTTAAQKVAVDHPSENQGFGRRLFSAVVVWLVATFIAACLYGWGEQLPKTELTYTRRGQIVGKGYGNAFAETYLHPAALLILAGGVGLGFVVLKGGTAR